MDLQLIGTKINTAIHTIINALVPDQIGNAGKFLTTNGSNTSWSDISSSSPRAIDLLFGQTDIEIDLSSVDMIFFEARGNGTITSGGYEQQNIQFTNWIEGKQYTIIVSNKWTNTSRLIVNQFIGNRVGPSNPHTQPSKYQITIFAIRNGIFYVIYSSNGNLIKE